MKRTRLSPGWLTAAVVVSGVVSGLVTGWVEAETGPAALSMSGRIVAVDSAQRTLTVEKAGMFQAAPQQKAFTINDQTVISDGSRSLRLEQLQPGQEVTIEYSEKDGKPLGRVITVKAGPAKAAPGAATPAAP